jgi:phenylalanyl-tRNA synthetase beta chain
MRAPLARVGAQLPKPDGDGVLEIGRATMRGVESHGMLCSARELGLSDDHGGLLALDVDAPPGTDLREALALDDRVFTIKLTPNRADCLSVLGVAREVAALTGAALESPSIEASTATHEATVPVTLSAPEACARFTGRVIRGVNAGAPTPAWMRERLERAGQRCISALVDVTNYVMLELGRPLHVYDVAKLQGGIDVRFARAGESLALLNGQTVALDADMLAITDARGPIGLAGIMGGETTKADLDTRDCFLEAAWFAPDAIAGRARRLGFSSDASHRFERGVDPANNVDGIERATALIVEICGGTPGSVVDTVATLPARPEVAMRTARARQIIGVPIPDAEIDAIFTRLGLRWRAQGEGDARVLHVTPPSFRFDLAIEADLIEEVARVWGFDRIPAEPPLAVAAMRPADERVRSLHALRHALADAGYHEVVNFSFVDAAWERDFAGRDDPVRVLNPIASQLSVMRTSLIGGLVANVAWNTNRRAPRVRVFEIGRVFLRDPMQVDGPLSVAGLDQPMRVAVAAFGPNHPEQWGESVRGVDFYDVKGDLEALLAPVAARFEAADHPALHPGRSARILVEGRAVGWLGEVHPRWQRVHELPGPVVVFEIDAVALQTRPVPVPTDVPKVPPVRRDLAMLVADAVSADAMLGALRGGLPPVAEVVEVFDVYRGTGVPVGKKSIAFRVLLQDTRKTLTDAEVERIMVSAREILERTFGAELR